MVERPLFGVMVDYSLAAISADLLQLPPLSTTVPQAQQSTLELGPMRLHH